MPLLAALLLPATALLPRSRRFLPSAAADADQPIIGDCLVFEGGAFDDPSLAPPDLPSPPPPPPTKPRRRPLAPPRPEELVPAEWREAQAALNLSKKERRVIAHKMRFTSRVEAGRRGRRLLPEGVGYREYREYRDAKMAALRPVVLDEPEGGWRGEVEEGLDGGEEEAGRLSGGRVEPRDPRVGVEKSSLEDIASFFNSARYNPPGVVEGNGDLFQNFILFFVMLVFTV